MEILLNNAIDEDFQSLFLPLNLLQNVYCTAKYRLKDNFITPNGLYCNVISFCYLILCLVMCVVQSVIIGQPKNNRITNKTLFTGNIFNLILTAIGFMINFFVSVTQSSNNVKLFLHLQNVRRMLNNNKSDFKLIKIDVWIQLFVLYATCIGVFVYFHYYFSYFDIYELIFDILHISFEVNMVYATTVMKLIANSMEYLHQELRTKVKNRDTYVSCHVKLFDIYINVMQSYNMFKKSFQVLILLHIVNTSLVALIYVEVNLELTKIYTEEKRVATPLVYSVISSIWLLKNVAYQVILGFEAERFYLAVQKTETTCILELKCLDRSDRRRKLYKNILRLNRGSFSKLSACRLFVIDAGSPLRFFSCIATYTIVLLQFAFL